MYGLLNSLAVYSSRAASKKWMGRALASRVNIIPCNISFIAAAMGKMKLYQNPKPNPKPNPNPNPNPKPTPNPNQAR